MTGRRLFVLAFVCALAFGVPALQAAGGAATNIYNGVCYWTCYGSGGTGSTPISPATGRNCLNACAAACGGPCIALY